MSNPYSVHLGGGASDYFAKVTGHGSRMLKDIRLTQSKEWEECALLAQALDHCVVYIWLDKDRGIKLYGRFVYGCLKSDANDNKVVMPIRKGVFKSSTRYSTARDHFNGDDTFSTLQPSVSNSKTHPYDFGNLHATVFFEYITDNSECRDVSSYEDDDHQWRRARPIGPADMPSIQTMVARKYGSNVIQRSERRRVFDKSDEGLFDYANPEYYPVRPNSFQHGCMLTVPLTAPGRDPDHVLQVPGLFWTRQSKQFDELPFSMLVRNVQQTHRTAYVHHTEDGGWPWIRCNRFDEHDHQAGYEAMPGEYC